MSTGAAFERLLGRTPSRSTERCELCATSIPDRHRHLFDAETGQPLCTCQACSLLFTSDTPRPQANRRYLLIPEKRTSLGPVSTAGLGVPVGLAFFVRDAEGRVTAHYPSPVGATKWEVDPQKWHDVTEEFTPLRDMLPDVEAFLVNTARGADERWLVPIDDCYRLIAIVRRDWRGWWGGDVVWSHIADFFRELAVRAGGRPTSPA